MPELRLETHEDQTHFQPGQMLHGMAGWELEEPPTNAEVRLSWYTEGKGDQDVRVVLTHPYEAPAAVDAQLFEFTLPAEPYSFSGTLITLRWALELIVDGKHSKRVDLVIAPEGREIDLAELDPAAASAP
ncbi:MAG: hypothetical protein WD294_01180 [Phycisphaeraceae bacterium]